MKSLILWFFLISTVYSKNLDQNSTLTVNESNEIWRFQIITNQWDHVKTPFTIALWLLIAAAVGKFLVLAVPIARFLPDSSIQIIIGLGLGALLHLGGASDDLFTLSSHVFFVYLLPPIILDAGYSMPNRAFMENVDSVVLLALVGTLWSFVSIGLSLYFLSLYNWFTVPFSLLEVLLFSSMISAVDPVAVIAVFEEIHVNTFLFVNVFGEALFNDSVSVMLYNILVSYNKLGVEEFYVTDYISGGLSFCTVALGGIVLGVLFALVTSFITRYAEELKNVTNVLIFLVPYLAYLTAEWWTISSIMTMAVCGMVMKQYVKGNLTPEANESVKSCTKLLAQSAEAVVFVYLGLSLLSSGLYWDWWFVGWTIFFCLLYRATGILVQCAFLNHFRDKQFSWTDQFILSYGGLRGPIAYGLAVSIPNVEAKAMFITTTIAVIYFTVFLQGSTIRTLVKLLRIRLDYPHPTNVTASINNKYLDRIMFCVESIVGFKGRHANNERYERFNAKVLRPILIRHEKSGKSDATNIIRAYARVTSEEALELRAASSKLDQEKRLAMLKSQPLDAKPKNQQASNVEKVLENGVEIADEMMLRSQYYSKGKSSIDSPSVPAKACTRCNCKQATRNLRIGRRSQSLGNILDYGSA